VKVNVLGLRCGRTQQQFPAIHLDRAGFTLFVGQMFTASHPVRHGRFSLPV